MHGICFVFLHNICKMLDSASLIICSRLFGITVVIFLFLTCPQTCARINWIVSCQSGFFGLYAPHAFNFHLARPKMDVVRDRPLENLWRGGGRSTKKIFAQGKITRKKIHALTPFNPKIYSCYALKKNSYKEFDNEKKFLRLENSPSTPHNFSNGPSLTTLPRRRF